MAYQLRIDEMLEALDEINHPQADQLIALVESTANVLAAALCEKLDIECGDASFEGVRFAGTCVSFHPKHEGQPIPDAIANCDDAEEWGA